MDDKFLSKKQKVKEEIITKKKGGHFIPTEEHEEIFSSVTLGLHNPKSSILKVVAGAGTGKTTTLVEIVKLIKSENCDTKITYLTFNNAAAAEARTRFGGLNVIVQTLNGAAHSLVNSAVSLPINLIGDIELEKYIKLIMQDKVASFLKGMMAGGKDQQEANKLLKAARAAERTVFKYIGKSFTTFLQSESPLSTFEAAKYVYYRAYLYHSSQKDRPSGLPDASQAKSFYFNCIQTLWESVHAKNMWTHDIVMKTAQQQEFRLNCSVLLVDESQDMNGCQIDWIKAQAKVNVGCQILLVGDPVQSIYSFRGAKPHLLMELSNLENVDVYTHKLTTSYRFGTQIAAMANVILCSKEHSPQTPTVDPNAYYPKRQTWMPYRLAGGGSNGSVTTRSLIGDSRDDVGKEGPLAILAFSNLELLMVALEQLLGFSIIERATPSQLDGSSGGLSSYETGTSELVQRKLEDCFDGVNIAINGKGDSGISKWQQVKKQLDAFLNIFLGKSSKLNYHPWNGEERRDEVLTWGSVRAEIEQRELAQFNTIVNLIETYKEHSVVVFEKFEENVLSRKLDITDSCVDIVLSTIHAAKGMEWDRVQIADSSLSDLSKYIIEGKTMDRFLPAKQLAQESPEQKITYRAEMDWKSYGDDYNLWYVAITRAKRLLSVPPKFVKLLEDLQKVEEMANLDLRTAAKIDALMANEEPKEDSIYYPCAEELSQEECLTPTAELPPLELSVVKKCGGGGDRGVKMEVPLTKPEVLAIYTHVAKPCLDELRETLGVDGIDVCVDVLELIK